ncbi:hypothetical protein LINPERHAP2_LOCUS3705 [Linum perenne]
MNRGKRLGYAFLELCDSVIVVSSDLCHDGCARMAGHKYPNKRRNFGFEGGRWHGVVNGLLVKIITASRWSARCCLLLGGVRGGAALLDAEVKSAMLVHLIRSTPATFVHLLLEGVNDSPIQQAADDGAPRQGSCRERKRVVLIEQPRDLAQPPTKSNGRSRGPAEAGCECHCGFLARKEKKKF